MRILLPFKITKKDFSISWVNKEKCFSLLFWLIQALMIPFHCVFRKLLFVILFQRGEGFERERR